MLHGKLKRQDKVCAVEGCNQPLGRHRSRYCSQFCADKAQGNIVRKHSARRRNSRRVSNPDPFPSYHEVRTIRRMQDVPAERWSEYEFVR